jgi:hypothetical protein
LDTSNTGSLLDGKKKAGGDPLGLVSGREFRDPTGALSELIKFDSRRMTLSATEDSRPSAILASTLHQQHEQKI